MLLDEYGSVDKSRTMRRSFNPGKGRTLQRHFLTSVFGHRTKNDRIGNDPALWAISDEAKAVVDPVKREKALHDAYVILRDSGHYMGFGYLNIPFGTGSRIAEWEPYPFSLLPTGLALLSNLTYLPAEFLSYLRAGAASAEGYLFPDTYRFPLGISARNILKTLADTMKRKLDDKLRRRAAELGFTLPMTGPPKSFKPCFLISALKPGFWLMFAKPASRFFCLKSNSCARYSSSSPQIGT